MARRIAAVIALFILAPVLRASAWETSFSRPGYDVVYGVRVDSQDNVVAAGSIGNAFSVAKLEGATGSVSWRRSFPGVGLGFVVNGADEAIAVGYGGNNATTTFVTVRYAADGTRLWRRDIVGDPASPSASGYAVYIDSASNIVASGSIGALGNPYRAHIVKLDNSSGAELWRQPIDGTAPSTNGGAFRQLHVDAADDIVASGSIFNAGTGLDFAVVKLSGATGTELWRYEIAGAAAESDHAGALELDGNGDVIAAGRVHRALTYGDFVVTKLSGATGAELWRTEINGTPTGDFDHDGVRAVAVDAVDDVYAVGLLDQGLTDELVVVKFAGATGLELWRQTLGSVGITNRRPSLAFDAAGRLLVSGSILGVEQDLVAVKLESATGTEIWRRTFNGRAGAGAHDDGAALAIDSADNVLLGATMNNATKPSYDFTVLKLSGSDGSDLVAAARGRFRDSGSPAARSIRVNAKAGIGISPSAASDPTVAGATLEIRNPTTGEADAYPLPVANWSLRTSSTGVRGFLYEDRGAVDGPCQQVRVDAGKLKLKCRGDQIGFTLDEVAQGSVAFRLRIGAGGREYCGVFGGEIRTDVAGRFESKNAPAPTGCPFP